MSNRRKQEYEETVNKQGHVLLWVFKPVDATDIANHSNLEGYVLTRALGLSCLTAERSIVSILC
jgi:hypothetical protein